MNKLLFQAAIAALVTFSSCELNPTVNKVSDLFAA